jgi:hypothetical protein
LEPLAILDPLFPSVHPFLGYVPVRKFNLSTYQSKNLTPARVSMSRIHARRHFLTTYFDLFYADLYIHPNKPEYNYDTNLFPFLRLRSSEPSYADRLGIDGPIERIQRSIAEAVAQVQRFILESWGTGGGDRAKAWPPT